MCTVTYLPLDNNNFILTSNRDENPSRKTISPKLYVEDGVSLTYPKDELAGGTWIGVSSKERLICLLNGGFVIHKRAKSYKKSRGVIVKELLKVDDTVGYINNYDFEGIEPFTIVLVDWKKGLLAYELVWTGEEKFFKPLKKEPKIWSSSTLYTEEMKELRKKWFSEWLQENSVLNREEILKFHTKENKETPEVSVKMKRENIETVSVTSFVKNEDDWDLKYINSFE